MNMSQNKVAGVSPMIYGIKGELVSLNVLRKDDLLVVFWKEPLEDSLNFIQSSNIYYSLIQFDRLEGLDGSGFLGRTFSCYSRFFFFRWDTISKIQIAGNDSTGRTMEFVFELYRQKVKAENTVKKMRANIDALKA